MAYRFETSETFADGFCRIYIEQLDHMQVCLAPEAISSEQIHEARKAIKRLRSLLRLVRPGLEESVFRHENFVLRDMGRQLGTFRDLAAMRETLQMLRTEDQSGQMTRHGDHLDNLLRGRLSGLMRTESSDVIDQVRKETMLLKSRGSDFDLKNLDADAVRAGLAATYKAGAKRLSMAHADGAPTAYHDCRKSVQQHWRHMQLLVNAWPAEISSRVVAIKEMSSLLGKDHDLHVLCEFARTQKSETVNDDFAVVEKQCRDRQGKLRGDVAILGELLFCERAGALAKRVLHYWRLAGKASNMAWQQARNSEPDLP